MYGKSRPHSKLVALALTLSSAPAAAQWSGFADESDRLKTDAFLFKGANGDPDYPYGNENYYDGDFADFDGDGLADRALGARYGLLMNTGGGLMTPYAGRTGFTFRGMTGAAGWGEDAFGWADVDNDGDYDVLSGGNGEPFVLQINEGGRFSVRYNQRHAALNIVNTDIEGDGDVDLAVACAFCATGCGGPIEFSLLVNDGTGNFTEEKRSRGLDYDNTDQIVGIVSGDVDGDGDLDLVIQHGPRQQADVAINDGTGHYTVRSRDIPTACSGFGQGMNLGDIDDDSDLDLVIARCAGGDGTAPSGHPTIGHIVAINDGSGAFTNESASRFDDAGYGQELSAGNGKLFDVDYDGDLDLVALRTHNDVGWPSGVNQVQVFLNDGSGHFTFSKTHTLEIPTDGNALGADTDITDLDRDGTYDLWVGVGGGRVRILMNTYQDPSGLGADIPRNLAAQAATANQVTLRWQAPQFAAAARYYKVYRATAAGLEDRDRRLLHYVGERHQDEALAAPITRHTTTAYLNDPLVVLDGASNAIEFTDKTVEPGQTYYYAVSHVGAENTESRHTAEVSVAVPGGKPADDTKGPSLDIISPTRQDWSAYPRIVVHYGDGDSGIDPASLRVSFDKPLGGRNAGEDLSDLAYRADDGSAIIALEPPYALPVGEIATLSVEVSDNAGNRTTRQEQFVVSVNPARLPTARMTASNSSGGAPLTVNFDASGSSDPDGKLLRWEWYFGDGTTAIGRQVDHTFAGGMYEVRLLVRDSDGGVATTTQTIDVSGDPAPCRLGASEACYSGPAGTRDVGACTGGTRTCSHIGWSECAGEVAPVAEDCSDGIDNDCDGATDVADLDCGGDAGLSGGAGDAGYVHVDGGAGGADAGGPSASAGGASASAGGENASGDAGSDGGASGTGATAGAPGRESDGGPAAAAAGGDSGCACRTASPTSPAGPRIWALAGIALALTRRRRPRRSHGTVRSACNC